MKCKNLWLLFFVFCSLIADAQQFKGGIVAGATFSQVDGDAISGYNKLGLQVGMQIKREVKNNWLWGAEVLYTQKGSRKRLEPDDPVRNIFILKLDYLELPVFAAYNSGKFTLTGGPSIGVLVNAKRDTGLGFAKLDDINRTETALKLGITAELTKSLSVYLNHSASLLRIGNPYQGGIYLFTRNGLYNRLFQFGLIYSL